MSYLANPYRQDKARELSKLHDLPWSVGDERALEGKWKVAWSTVWPGHKRVLYQWYYSTCYLPESTQLSSSSSCCGYSTAGRQIAHSKSAQGQENKNTHDWKRAAPYDFTAFLAHADVTYALDGDRVLRVMGVFEHNEGCCERAARPEACCTPARACHRSCAGTATCRC